MWMCSEWTIQVLNKHVQAMDLCTNTCTILWRRALEPVGRKTRRPKHLPTFFGMVCRKGYPKDLRYANTEQVPTE